MEDNKEKKIVITKALKKDIVESRKEKNLTSHELSQQSGHTKFWLQNIENGKTQKISLSDLISIYKVLIGSDDEEKITSYIENILNQNLVSDPHNWYSRIPIDENYLNIDNDNDLMDELDSLLYDEIIPKIRGSVFNMESKEKKGALSALKTFDKSLYLNPELAFLLVNIPVYGVEKLDYNGGPSYSSEYIDTINDLLSISSKYQDYASKNNSLETIKEWQERDEYYHKQDCQNARLALDNLNLMIKEIINASKQENPDLRSLANDFNVNVTFMIDRSQPDAMKYYLPTFRMHTGPEFVKHINECINWFKEFQQDYDLPPYYKVVNKTELTTATDYLNNLSKLY